MCCTPELLPFPKASNTSPVIRSPTTNGRANDAAEGTRLLEIQICAPRPAGSAACTKGPCSNHAGGSGSMILIEHELMASTGVASTGTASTGAASAGGSGWEALLLTLPHA